MPQHDSEHGQFMQHSGWLCDGLSRLRFQQQQQQQQQQQASSKQQQAAAAIRDHSFCKTSRTTPGSHLLFVILWVLVWRGGNFPKNRNAGRNIIKQCILEINVYEIKFKISMKKKLIRIRTKFLEFLVIEVCQCSGKKKIVPSTTE
jgi:membrane protease subunit (stomatin/prohibitin family)